MFTPRKVTKEDVIKILKAAYDHQREYTLIGIGELND
jgi:hypothetical protein